jgi:hypothetical protein
VTLRRRLHLSSSVIPNPYLDELESLRTANPTSDTQAMYARIMMIGLGFPDDPAGLEYSLWRRNELVQKYAWAIPDEFAIRAIAARSPIVEIGAGNGYWASRLALAGADIVAYDDRSWKMKWTAEWHPVAVGGADAAAAHSDRALFLCWPPHEEQLMHDALRAYQGQTVIYIGEGGGGATGTDEAHMLLEAQFHLIQTTRIPKYWGMHDRLYIYTRKAVDAAET